MDTMEPDSPTRKVSMSSVQQGSKQAVETFRRGVARISWKAMRLALPSAIFAAVLKYLQSYHPSAAFLQDWFQVNTVVFGSFSSLLGFLIVFRTSQSYNRYWEGCTLTHQMMGDWYDTASSLVAFTNYIEVDKDPDDVAKQHFKHKIVRLFSILFAVALAQLEDSSQSVEESRAYTFQLLDVGSLDNHSLEYLKLTDNKVELVAHWIQYAMVQALGTKVLTIPPPILSRAFQELSNGVVRFHDCMKIAHVPFPPPYHQTMMVLAALHMVLTPWFICNWVSTIFLAWLITCLLVFVIWSLLFIATELEQPFGIDEDDINLEELQTSMNARLLLLVSPAITHVPTLRAGAKMTQFEITHGSSMIDMSLRSAWQKSASEVEEAGAASMVSLQLVSKLAHSRDIFGKTRQPKKFKPSIQKEGKAMLEKSRTLERLPVTQEACHPTAVEESSISGGGPLVETAASIFDAPEPIPGDIAGTPEAAEDRELVDDPERGRPDQCGDSDSNSRPLGTAVGECSV
eukprot:gnl/TRDRNA2_/TRDRNA2_173005_c1_seq11.p1 gnl/TRDRNA2_/TRDRNA2_173005_c1~~gnl/TRDRNA2_/TRDRNA2_173005_c1_seq11.p1  ORF type:complete len:515 (+),score=80.37 gnl/TRDRNA2_/TRDRNA2_173005_c1_seq11:95-1639(+)